VTSALTPDSATGPEIDWPARAAQVEAAVLGRHLRRIVGLPGTGLGLVSWPATVAHRLSGQWNFWWQAHLLDCAVDAWIRSPDPDRRARVALIVRSIRLRNFGRFTNVYYDDMAWIGLALQRAEPAGAGDARAVRSIVTRILDAWSPPVGGIPWRVGTDFFNAPANGPAAILLARSGFRGRAGQMADWLDANLRLPGCDLIADGFHPGEVPLPVFFSYSQGVVLGAEVELSGKSRDRSRIHRLVAAVERDLTDGGVLRGHGGGNGGLFTGILARYLTVVATTLPGTAPADETTRARATSLVLRSAAAAWANRACGPWGPLLGADWTIPAIVPRRRRRRRRARSATARSWQPERDLSVQLSGWMLMEAAASLTR